MVPASGSSRSCSAAGLGARPFCAQCLSQPLQVGGQAGFTGFLLLQAVNRAKLRQAGRAVPPALFITGHQFADHPVEGGGGGQRFFNKSTASIEISLRFVSHCKRDWILYSYV